MSLSGQGSRRVAVTGIGVLGPVGAHPGPFWPRLRAGESGTRLVTRFDAAGLSSRIAGEVPDFEPAAFVRDPRDLVHLDRTSQLAIAAAELAVRDSGLGAGAFTDAAVIVGSGFGCIETIQDGMFAFHEKDARAARAGMIPRGMANAPAAAISIHLAAHGPHHVIASACASGTIAIGNAARLVSAGHAPLAVAGGADAPLLRSILAGWCAMRVVSLRNTAPASACRPFSADRDGFVLAEGAAMLVLEELSAARARGAAIYAEIAGYGESSDASHLTMPSLVGEVRAIRGALASACLDAEAIDHVNAHGTATIMNDRVETQALVEALGPRARRVPVSATKSLTGHAMGASGAMEVAAAALAVRDQIVHPTVNLGAPDPECDLDYVTEGSRKVDIRNALKTSFAFGGANVALILSRSEP
jgi:3-oxoacyl-[acyl-carrier-protein] synthase II